MTWTISFTRPTSENIFGNTKFSEIVDEKKTIKRLCVLLSCTQFQNGHPKATVAWQTWWKAWQWHFCRNVLPFDSHRNAVQDFPKTLLAWEIWFVYNCINSVTWRWKTNHVVWQLTVSVGNYLETFHENKFSR